MQGWVKPMHLDTLSLFRSAVWQAALTYLCEGDKLCIASRATSQQQKTSLGGAFLSFDIRPWTAIITARGYNWQPSPARFVLHQCPQPFPGDEEASPSLLDVISMLLKSC